MLSLLWAAKREQRESGWVREGKRDNKGTYRMIDFDKSHGSLFVMKIHQKINREKLMEW